MRTVRLGNISAALLATLALTSVSIVAANWPTFRNDATNAGASAELIGPLTEQWHSTAPRVEENGVVVANGVAYMMSSGDSKLYAFTVSNGFAAPGFPVNIGQSFGTPAVDPAAGHVYALAVSTLYAFNLDGTSAWTRAVGAAGANYSQGPVIDGGFVYLEAGSSLQKFDSTGTLQWTSAAGGNDTQPAIMDGFVYKNTQGGQILKFDKATGVQVIGGGFPISTTGAQSSLTTVDGKIFFKTDELRVYDASTGAALWHQPIGGTSTFYNSAAVANGSVYVYGWDGRLYAFDETTGATQVGFPSVALNTATSRNWSSPAVSGDKVFVGAGTTQRLKVLGAVGSAQAGLVLEDHLAFSTDTQGFDLCSPAVSDGFVFAMLDGGGLYAYFGGTGTRPSGALKINGGAGCTTSQVVTLTLDNNNNPNVTSMRISEDPFFNGASFVPYQQTSSFTLSAGFGSKTIYAQLRDNQNQLSNVFTAQIKYQAQCSIKCDVNGDGFIDATDLQLIRAANGQNATSADDPRDGNSDGRINVADVRYCQLRMTR